MSLLCAIPIVIASYLAGDAVFSAWGLRGPRAERLVFASAIGLTVLSLAVTLLAFAHLLYAPAAWLILIALILRRFRPAWHAFQDSTAPGPRFDDSGFSWFARFNQGFVALLLLMATGLALAPPTATDALVYHLAVPKAFLEHHGVVNLPNNIYSYFPQHFEMVFLLGLMTGGEGTAQWLGVFMTALLLGALCLHCRDRLSPRFAWLAPALYLSAPTFWEGSATGYIDVPMAGFVFFAFYSWERWRETARRGWLHLMCLFAGAAVATKLTAVIVLPLAFLAIVVDTPRDQPRQLAQNLVFFCAAVGLLLLPWWLRNFHFSGGNPFVPYFMDLLGGSDRVNWDGYRSALQLEYYRSFGMGRGLVDFLLLPTRLTFDSRPASLRFDGQIGVAFFLLIPALAGWLLKSASGESDSRRPAVLWGLFILLMVFWFQQSQYIRLLAPAFAFLAVLTAGGLGRLAEYGRLGRVGLHALCALAAAGLLYNFSIILHPWQKLEPWRYLAGQESRDAYLERNLPPSPIYRAANAAMADGDRVLLVFARNFGYLMDRPFHGDSFFEAHTLQSLLSGGPSIERLAERFASHGFTHLMLADRFIFGPDSALDPAERKILAEYLQSRAQLLGEKNGYRLYRL